MLPVVDAVTTEDEETLPLVEAFDALLDAVDDDAASCPTYERVAVEKYNVRSNGKTRVSKSDRTTKDSGFSEWWRRKGYASE